MDDIIVYYSFKQLINRPNRLTETSPTLSDYTYVYYPVDITACSVPVIGARAIIQYVVHGTNGIQNSQT